MLLTCPHCALQTTIDQEYPYHSGFSDMGFLYCDSCPNTFVFSSCNKSYNRFAGEKHPWSLNAREKRNLEKHIRPCSCGGRFRFSAFPRCPHCGKDLSSLLPDTIHFIIVGQKFDGDKENDLWLE
jgi:hypothetical protein